MRQVLNDIQTGELTEELSRRENSWRTDDCVLLWRRSEDDDLPMAAINASGGAFDWLADEPDIYGDSDLVERYR